jgi:prophage tail gpP-like protein
MPVDESILLVQLELQGRALLNEITAWSIDSDYLTTTDGFEFSAYSDDLSKVRGLELEPVELKVNGHSQLIGRIDSSTIGHKGGEVTYSGRDYLADMVECSIDPNVTVKEEMNLSDAIKAVSGTVGISSVLGSDATRNIRSGKSLGSGAGRDFISLQAGDIKPDYGMSQFGFLSRIVARHGATIQPGNARNEVVLSEPDYSQAPAYTLQRLKGTSGGSNNVIRGIARRDFSRLPTVTLFNGSQTKPAEETVPTSVLLALAEQSKQPLAVLGSGAATSLALGLFGAGRKSSSGDDGTKSYNTAGAASGFAPSAEDTILKHCHIGRRRPKDGTGDPLKLYRLLAVRDKTARNQDQLDRLAVREVGERLKELLVYEVEVQGHVASTGAIWSVNTMVDVIDEECDIAEPMWVASRRLSFDSSGGARTTMVCWRPGAFLT